ncbi:IclR family transcriptional regulator [Paenibacillus doosanensis]|uniref:HTH-type transcriptional repressor AllR n=1 Tax=Paenibacillus konkukensis TaxID=2020716 RepID=A0ABY4RLD2_9BACL|nr:MULTISPECIES: IclR family transcriptional regulator [Paenibacillus]MCS7462913.1 IclR family transcriptional regulator [Paenibacillus doosanensis]UQZ82393.1 HTH-type transcriptional repressor AllR [Paenibacillus konkukensis]
MEQKYAVPALDRANAVLHLLAAEPLKWKLSDLSRQLGISKSTMFSLLASLERLEWIIRDRNDTYALGPVMGSLGSAYFRQYDVIEEFRRLAEPVMRKLMESVQLAQLEGSEVLYLSKIEAPSPVQMVSGPGARFPAHATGLGKALMSGMSDEQVRQIWTEEKLPQVTAHTIASRETLLRELEQIRRQGYATDIQEGVMGFCCVAAPVRRRGSEAMVAVSCSMPLHHWEQKRSEAAQAILHLAEQMSQTR